MEPRIQINLNRRITDRLIQDLLIRQVYRELTQPVQAIRGVPIRTTSVGASNPLLTIDYHEVRR